MIDDDDDDAAVAQAICNAERLSKLRSLSDDAIALVALLAMAQK